MKKLKIPVKANLFEHQKKAFEFVMDKFKESEVMPMNISKSKAAALLMEMGQLGTGKTVVSIAIAGALFNNEKIEKLLIVCPLSICSVWEEEFLKFADFQYNLKILKGSSSKKAETLLSLNGQALQVAVVNYESVWRLEKQIRK